MATAHRLAGIAHGLVQKVDDADPMASMEEMRAVAVLAKIGNEAAHIGLNLLAANKAQTLIDERDKVPAGLGHFYGESDA